MKRVLIIGNPGAGKSTLARQLAPLLDLPLIHLDCRFWKPNWVPTERALFREEVSELVAADRWIIDGNYDSCIDLRLPRADTVIFLDYATWRSLWGVVKRRFKYHGQSRPDVAPGCREQLDFDFLRFALTFKKKIRGKIVGMIEQYFQAGNLITLRTPAEVRAFVVRLERGRSADSK